MSADIRAAWTVAAGLFAWWIFLLIIAAVCRWWAARKGDQA